MLLRRGWMFVVVGIVAGLAVGALLAATLPKQYAASSAVLVTPTGVNDSATLTSSRTSGTVNLDTEAAVVTSSDVAKQVQTIDAATKTLSIAKLTKPVSITVPPNTSILTITYTSDSAVLSATRANDFATAYLDRRKADAEATLKAEIDKSQLVVDTLTTQFKSISTSIGKLPAKSAQLDFARSQRSVVLGQLKQLTRDVTAFSTTAVTPGRILKTATTPSSASSPSRVLLLSGGLAGGLLLGLIAAWLRFAVRARLQHPVDVVRLLKLPVLGEVTTAKVKGTAAVAVPEVYRRIVNVLLATRSEPGVLLVTGNSTKIALSSVVANLAAALAGLGHRVLEASAGDPTGAGALASRQLSRPGLDAARGERWLLIAGIDPTHTPEVQAAGAASDMVILVVEAHSKTARSSGVIEQLDSVGAPLLGAILVPSGRWWNHRPAQPVAAPTPYGETSDGETSDGRAEQPSANGAASVREDPGSATAEGAQPGIARRP